METTDGEDNSVTSESGADQPSMGEVHRCPHCGSAFVFKNSLTKHMNKRRCVTLKESKSKAGGDRCSAVECSNSRLRDSSRGIKFYRFPKDTIRRNRWITLVNRKEPSGSLWNPDTYSRLCSEHFLSGKKSEEPDDPDYEPSIFGTRHVKPKKPSDLARFNRRKRRHDEMQRRPNEKQSRHDEAQVK